MFFIPDLMLIAGLVLAGEKGTPDRAFYREPLPPGALLRLGSSHLRAEGELTALALSPDRKLLAGSDADGVVYLWNRATGKRLHRLNAKVPGGGLAFSPDGKRLAALNRMGQG